MTRIDALALTACLVLAIAAVWLNMSPAQAVDASGAPQNYITIHRTFSDIDGRESAWPAVYVSERRDGGIIETRHDGETVIARQLKSGEWSIKVGGKEFKTRDKRESATYFDQGPSLDNPGAIRS